MNILLVEDDELDIVDTRRTLDKMRIFYQLHVTKNGVEAIDFLEADATLIPDVVLIDISMPKMDGLELLSVIRNDDRWKHLKCFIITTSEDKMDRETAKNMNVAGYIVKPLRMNNAATLDAFNLMIDIMNLSPSFPK